MQTKEGFMFYIAAALVNDATLQERQVGGNSYRAIGDPTEGSLLIAAAKAGLWKSDLDHHWPRVAEVPFTSERKRMTTIHKHNIPQDDATNTPWRVSPYVAFCKGADDEMLAVTSAVWSGERAVPLNIDLN